MKNNISTIHPRRLSEVRGMSPAIIAKCHASNQLHLIEQEQKKLKQLKTAWKRRYTTCLREIDRCALEEAENRRKARKK